MGVPRLLVLALLVSFGCGRTADLSIELARPLDPDPFFEVARIRLVAVADGEQIDLGAWPWDRGPIDLNRAIAPSFERLIVFGVDSDGRLVASGVSEPLDVVREPPDGPVRIYFSAVGRLSRADLDLVPRVGGFGATGADGVWIGGGVDAGGCARMDLVEVTSRLEVRDRSSLPSGRLFAQSVNGVGGGALVVEGEHIEGCAPSATLANPIAISEPNPSPREVSWPEGGYPAGAATVGLAEGSFVVAGGVRDGSAVARTDVSLLDVSVEPPRVSVVGQLDRPRAGASAIRLSNSRVLFVGGRASTSTRTFISEASAFDLSSGRTVASSDAFDLGATDLAHARVASGALVFAGGVSADGPSARVASVAVDPDASGRVERARELGELGAPGTGRLLDLEDGSVLFVPNDEARDLAWIRLLPLSFETVPRPGDGAGRLVGGVLEPGLAALAGEDGSVWTFHSGPAGALGRTAPVIERPDPDSSSGLMPSDPLAASFEGDALVVQGPEFFGLDLLPEQLVLITPEDIDDFELTVSYRILEPQSRPSIVYGFGDGDYDHIVLQAAPQVVRSPARRGSGRVACDPVTLPQLPAVGPHRVRLRRSGGGRRLALDLGADGTEELRCDTPIPRSGAIALGVVSGRVAFDGVRLRIR